MAYKIVNKISEVYVPKFGNTHEYIAIHYLGVDGQNYELSKNGTGAHYTIYWDGTIFQRCSHDAIVWAVGTAGIYAQKHPYARNANTISIELCCHCDGNKGSASDPYWYFTKETQEAAVWLVQKLMKDLKIPINHVLRHYDIVNKICPAPYVHNNKYKTSWTWNEFLERVKGGNAGTTPSTTAASGIPQSKEDFINKVSKICVDLYKQTKILPSVVAAQCCLQNGYGLGSDAIELTKRNNLLGMKADLINGSWSNYTVWDGTVFSKITPEYVNGKLIRKPDNFRVYKDYKNCIEDYQMFLLHVKNNKGYKYNRVKGMTDPGAVIHAIRIGTGTASNPQGYCTDPNYEEKVLRIIKENNLAKLDIEAGATSPVPQPKTVWYRVAQDYKNGKYINQDNAYEIKANAIARAKAKGLKAYDQNGNQIYPQVKAAAAAPVQTPAATAPAATTVDRYVVRRRWSESQYQLGAYQYLSNAKNKANQNWGFRVYDLQNPKTVVYKPKLNRVQKLLAACARLNQWLVDDIAAGKDWRYYNSGHVSESTFWKTRKANKLYTNCMGGVAFAMKQSGLPASACSWYGQKGGGIRWLNSHAQADLRKYADLIKVGNKTPKQLMNEGKLCPGDILTFVTINHTCIYFGNGLSFDSGHAFCKEKGEGAHFVKWIGPLSWPNYKVGYIIRLKP